MEYNFRPRRSLPTTNELICFEAAARYQSFTQAAEALSLTQSAVSKQIDNLEKKLRLRLFERVKQRVVLTNAGRSFQARAREILAHIDLAVHSVTTHGSRDVLRVAVLPTLAARWLLPRLPAFLGSHPDIAIEFVTRLAPFDFDEDPADCALQYGESIWPKATTVQLFDEEMVPLASHEYARRMNIQEPADLQSCVLIEHLLRPHLWNEWLTRHGIAHQESSPSLSFDQFEMVVRAAVAGMGVALLPLFLIEDELRIGRLKVLFELPLNTLHCYYMAVPHKKERQRNIGEFIDWLNKEAQNTKQILL